MENTESASANPSTGGQGKHGKDTLAGDSYTNSPQKLREAALHRTNSHPFFVNGAEGKSEFDRFATRNRLLNWIANGLFAIVSALCHYGWQILHVLLNPLVAFITTIFPVLEETEAPDGSRTKRLRAIRGDDDEELITLMETQTQTLLEINKFLREELLLIKEERDAAEQIIAKVEHHCREAMTKHEKVIAQDLLNMLYGGAIHIHQSPQPN
ncbi:uncharacterized protein LOC129590083 isoform X2 [Paramacrobiotus metropolitanus]|uniref:uncharacterized protein LOC129590083 isoform X2 n=1 Tax=Paramacrobiotus metropolitanus TaxID=2943436 RepID=UPI002446536C|nr:uncharacterized protein LOC129590083 isoform X2 [Paramacrobiotus metropolitanus]